MKIRILNTDYDMRIPRHQDEVDRAIKLSEDLAEYSAGELRKAIAGLRGLPSADEKRRYIDWIRIYVPFLPADTLIESEPEEILKVAQLLVQKVREELDGPPAAPRRPRYTMLGLCQDLTRPHSRRGMPKVLRRDNPGPLDQTPPDAS